VSKRQISDTVVTNIVQQATGILTFLILPNLLNVEDYGEVVYVGVLLSFLPFADLGFSFVYNKEMPVIYQKNNPSEIQMWNDSIFTFRFYSSILFSGIISLILFIKYHDVMAAICLFLACPLNVMFLFYASKCTAQADFAAYKKVLNFNSVVKLLVIPFVLLLSLRGWFVGQFSSSILSFVQVSRKQLPDKLRLSVILIKQHFIEAILLGLSGTLWYQLLGSGRFFASFMYPDTVLAQYGLLNSGYQIIASLTISAFVPQTVKIYKLLALNEEEAIEYVFNVITYALPIVFFLAVIVLEASPFVIKHLFPQYRIDPVILTGLMLSIVAYPIFLPLGSVLIGGKKTIPFLFIIVGAFSLNFMMVLYFNHFYSYRAPAIAQFVAAITYSVLNIILIFFLFNRSVKNKVLKVVKTYGSLSAMLIIYAGFKLY
jgi:O-antigen/teichoic acid export membrane protein